MASVVGGCFRAGEKGKPLRAPRPRRGVVPLVPCDGGDHLSRSGSRQAHPLPVYRGASGPGFATRSLKPLRGLRLAGHHCVRRERRGDRQAPGLHPSAPHGFHAASDHRRPDAGAVSPARRTDRSRQHCLLAPRERAGISHAPSRWLRFQESRMGIHPQIPGLECRRILHVRRTP